MHLFYLQKDMMTMQTEIKYDYFFSKELGSACDIMGSGVRVKSVYQTSFQFSN